MNKKIIFVVLLLVCFALTGCAAPYTFLKSNQKDLRFKPTEGGILLSFDGLKPNALVIQEINQYKPFAQKKIKHLSLYRRDKQNEGIYLLNVRVSSGTYLLLRVGGLTTSSYVSQTYIPCWKIFDVVPGEITYIGRVKNVATPQGDATVASLEIEDYYEIDIKWYADNYPVLQSKSIKKELLY